MNRNSSVKLLSIVKVPPSGQSYAMNNHGINVVGDLTARRGLTEAARFTIQALQENGIDLSFVEALYEGFPLDQRDANNSLLFKQTGHRYPINLLFYGLATFPSLSDEQLRKMTANKYTVAYWQWEFPSVPEEFLPQFNRVDEIWTASTFYEQHLVKATDRPVMVVPHPIFPKLNITPNRAQFGISENRFMFLFIFDAAGSVARKNPNAIISAFERAFGNTSNKSNAPILVIKARHLEQEPSIQQVLSQRMADIGGLLLTENHSREQTDNLMACADAYISLHRAEGFGLTMAEAMIMGKPVIATGYSSNVDYMNNNNSYLVDYTLRPVLAEDHTTQPRFLHLYTDRLWADPDIDQAAAHMAHLVSHPLEATEKGKNAAHTIQTQCSPQAVAKLVRDRVETIYEQVAQSVNE